MFGIGDKKDTPIKQSDVTRVLHNIQMRKSGTHPVRFNDGEVVEIDPKVAFRINNWLDQRPSMKSKEDEKMVSSWEGFQKIAKLLGIEKMIPKPKMADDINRMLELAGVEEGYYKLPDFDSDKYQQRDGLEGPIPTRSGKVLYYDPKEGMYYDPDTDMFVDYDEFRKYDDVSWMDKSQDTMEAKPGDSMGMNKYGISAVHKDGKFYAFRNGKMVGGPFDTIEQLADFQKKSIENESYSPWTSTNKHPETMNRRELEQEIEIFKQQEKVHALDPGEQAQLDSLYYYLENLKDGEYDDLHDEFNELVGIEENNAQQELPLPVNYSFTKTDFLDNEAENMHTENAVELAMMFGTEEEQKRMNMIMTAHNTRGYILPDEQEERDALVRKYYPMLEDVEEAVDINTGKEQPKTVMGVNVRSKEDKIRDKKQQIALAKRNAPKSGLTQKDVPQLEKELANLMKEDDPAPTPKGNSVLDRLRLIVKDKQNAKVQLDDGHLTVDLYTASAITQVYDKVNDANKAKMEKMMNTKEGLVKLTNAVFGMLNKRKDENVTEATEEEEVKQILDKHNVTDAEDIDYGSKVYDELFDYYSNSGEMPYGVMKARTGMPDEWIYDRLQDLGLLEAKLTKAQIKKRDKIADKMPDADFKKRYGKDWEAVKYGAATNMVKDDINEDIIDETVLDKYRQLIERRLEEAHTMICKYCGDEIYKPTTDCGCDCNNPDGDNWVIKRTMEDNVQEGEQVTREEEQQLLKKVDEFKTKDQEIKDIEAKEKALQDIQMNKHTKDDPELQDELKKRKAELERLKKLAGV